MEFYLVEYRQLFDPETNIELLIVDDYEAWKRWKEKIGYYICYEQKLDFAEARRMQSKVAKIRIEKMKED